MQDSLLQKTVLVTGAAGFIGSHLCEQLLSAGAQVYGVDNFLTGRDQNIEHLRDNPAFHFIEADVITQPSSYLPPSITFDYMLHFASPASPPRYQAHPVATYLVNSQATHQLLQYLLHTNPKGGFLFASTSEVYGDPEHHPQSESYWGNVNPNGVRSCYDEAKRLGETMCGVHHRDLGLDVRIIRIFNTYGPRMDPSDGRIIPQFIMEALKNQAISIYGDGSQTRSYCYVDDLVKGILLVLTTPVLAGETINLGNPGEFTVLETAQIISSMITGSSELRATYAPLPQDDPLRRKPDISKAQKLLGWQPDVEFEQGLLKVIEYFKSQV